MEQMAVRGAKPAKREHLEKLRLNVDRWTVRKKQFFQYLAEGGHRSCRVPSFPPDESQRLGSIGVIILYKQDSGHAFNLARPLWRPEA